MAIMLPLSKQSKLDRSRAIARADNQVHISQLVAEGRWLSLARQIRPGAWAGEIDALAAALKNDHNREPEAQLIAITDTMAAALARHGCHPAGSAIRSAWFAGLAASGPDQSRKIAEMETEIQLLRLAIDDFRTENARLYASLRERTREHMREVGRRGKDVDEATDGAKLIPDAQHNA